MTFICTDCKDRKHDACKGSGWCDCHHREVVK